MEPAVTPAIELHRLARRYGAVYVLKDIGLVVSSGRVVVLKGDNGAGKTTLLKVLATSLRPSRGQGRVFGFDLIKDAHEVRRRTAYLSVLGGSYGSLTAQENLALSATLYGKRVSADVLEANLAEVGLQDARHKLVRSFSSGMKKRLGIARLLLAEADLWLLDEPYAALDEGGKTLVDDLLVRAKLTGKTVMMASHDLERSAAFADRVLTLEGGYVRVLGAAPVSSPTPASVSALMGVAGV